MIEFKKLIRRARELHDQLNSEPIKNGMQHFYYVPKCQLLVEFNDAIKSAERKLNNENDLLNEILEQPFIPRDYRERIKERMNA